MSDQRRLQQEEQLLELLADQAQYGLDDAQTLELSRLLDELDQTPDDDMELVAAAVYLAMDAESDTSPEPMPAALADRLIAQGESSVGSPAPADIPASLPFPDQASRFGHPAWGWLAAAAMLALTVATWIATTPDKSAPDPAALRTALIHDAPDTFQTPWTASDDPVYGKVTGDVTWSDDRQEGYMRLAGLPVNDPSVEQYQLWIVDPDVDANPVDGGVFDVTSDGEVIVPIQAKLRVDKPIVFAITVERPGGVVVSKGPLRVVAPVGT